MSDDSRARFGAGAEAWADYNEKPLGRIRREVTWHNLAPHLPDAAGAKAPPRVLDVGGGSGELALRLARRGYSVWLLDYAPAMLDQARRRASALQDDVCTRLTLCLMSVDDAVGAFPPGFFDVITCHTLVEYLPEPRDTLSGLSGLLRSEGLLSLSFVNRHAEVLRQVWSRGDPAGALSKLEQGGFCARLFDVPGVAYTVEEASAWLRDLGLTVTANYGVRSFADYVPRDRLNDAAYFEALLGLELAAASRAPYRWMARYVHLIANNKVEVC
jgi:S-adenosylmethionine-dependent methyltransferase